MLYKLNFIQNKQLEIEPIVFFEDDKLERYEEYIENLLVKNLLNRFFEESTLMPLNYEKSFKKETSVRKGTNIYALNPQGDLILFEFMRGFVNTDRILNSVKHIHELSIWDYDKLNNKFSEHSKGKDLSAEHKKVFGLNRALPRKKFNKAQHLYIIGNAYNRDLKKTLEDCQDKGINIKFLSYRLYPINGELYIEFCQKPLDYHLNPSATKGVIIETTNNYDENSLWEMLENNKISAYGDEKYLVNNLSLGDTVFLSYNYVGIIAAAKVKSKTKSNGNDEKYVDVKFITDKPQKEIGIQKILSFAEINKTLGYTFYGGETIKLPYLSPIESIILELYLK